MNTRGNHPFLNEQDMEKEFLLTLSMYPAAVRALLQRHTVIRLEWIATVITLTVVAC